MSAVPAFNVVVNTTNLKLEAIEQVVARWLTEESREMLDIICSWRTEFSPISESEIEGMLAQTTNIFTNRLIRQIPDYALSDFAFRSIQGANWQEVARLVLLAWTPADQERMVVEDEATDAEIELQRASDVDNDPMSWRM